MDDVELDQGVSLGLLQPGKDAVEGRLAVDQKLHVVAAQERGSGETLHGLVARNPFHGLDCVGSEALLHGLFEVCDLFVPLVPGLHVALEVPPSENPIRWNGDVGEGDETQPPCDSTLSGAGSHDRIERREHPKDLKDEPGRHDHPPPLSPPRTGRLRPALGGTVVSCRTAQGGSHRFASWGSLLGGHYIPAGQALFRSAGRVHGLRRLRRLAPAGTRRSLR